MWDFIIIMLRVLASMGGLLFIYAAVFLYEDEQGKLQNKLEDWWIRIEDTQRTMLSRHTNLMRYLAGVMTSVIDRLFGARLLSIQSVGVSICYSYASVIFVSILYILLVKFVGVKYLDIENTFQHMPIVVALFLLIISTITMFFFLFLGTLPSFTSRIVWQVLWSVLLGGFFILWLISMYSMSLIWATDEPDISPPKLTAIMFAVLLVGLGASSAFSTAFIAITRKILRWSSGLDSASKITAVILLNSALSIVLIAAPLFWIHTIIESDWISNLESDLSEMAGFAMFAILGGAAFFTAVSNTIPALLSILFVGFALIMLVHQLLWPLLLRPIYALQRLGIAKRSKLLGTVGALLVTAGIGKWAWVEKIVDKLSPF